MTWTDFTVDIMPLCLLGIGVLMIVFAGIGEIIGICKSRKVDVSGWVVCAGLLLLIAFCCAGCGKGCVADFDAVHNRRMKEKQ